MKRLFITGLAAMLAACASTPAPPGVQVSAGKVATVMSDQTGTRASVLAALGATRKVVFDSAYETWLYQVPAEGGRYREFVVLIGPDGTLRKTRLREAELPATK